MIKSATGQQLNLNTPISRIKGVGSRYTLSLNKKGIRTVKDLIFYFPFRYENFSEFREIRSLRPGEKVTVEGVLKDFQKKTTRRRGLSLVEGTVYDRTGIVKIVWFNQPYLMNSLVKEATYRFSGKVDFNGNFLTMTNPTFERSNNPTVNTGALLPVYHEDYVLNSRFLRKIIFSLLQLCDQIPETLPSLLLKNFKLMALNEAVREIHRPSSEAKKDEARRRLAFEELFLIQLYLGQRRNKWKKNRSPSILPKIRVVKKFVESLPFKLTNAQRRASWEIIQDLGRGFPMNRLLEGDVGSGKTVVAGIAALVTAKNGFQAVFLAPTEILAIQHWKTLIKFFKGIFKEEEIGIFTRSSKATVKEKLSKEAAVKKIKSGKIKIIAGTHAVLQKEIDFKRLGLIVIDEQHRFGVNQRSFLQNKISLLEKEVPHLLSMSATPIPRTLALAVYSDLELSILNELPAGRREIVTRIVTEASREKMYAFIRQEILKGRQAFVICPLIGEDEENPFSEKGLALPLPNYDSEEIAQIEIKAVKKESEYLAKKIFPEFKIATLHGKMKGPEKDQIMRDFKEGKSHILVATSVVEVGVDVPNSTIMLIEGAERFGLAQLHQFRGRVGRSDLQSYCFLSLSEGGITANRRLEALVKTNDGFKLAEADLKLRGPGDFIGIRQSGLPDLTMASLSDGELIKIAKGGADLILAKSPDLKEFPELKTRLNSFLKTFHGE